MTTPHVRHGALHRALEVLLLIVLPVLAFVLIGDQAAARRDEGKRQHLESRLEQDLLVALARSNPVELLDTYFQHVRERLARSGFSAEAITRLPPFPIPEFNLRLFGFTPEKVPACPLWSDTRYRNLMQKLWDCLLTDTWPSVEQRMFRNLFGSMLRTEMLVPSRSLPYTIYPERKPGTLFWDNGPGRGGLVLISPSLPRLFHPLRHLLRRRLLASDGVWGLYDERLHRTFFHGSPWPAWKGALRKCALQESGPQLIDGFLCQAVRHPQGLWVFRAFPAVGLLSASHRVLIWATGLLVILWLVSRSGAGDLGFRHWPLSRKLFSLFSLAFLSSGTALLLMALGTFTERVKVAEQEFRSQALERLQEVDRQFRAHQESVLRSCREIRDDPVVRAGKPTEVASLAERLFHQGRLTQFEICSQDADLLAAFNVAEGRIMLTRFFAREVMHRYLRGIATAKENGVMAAAGDIMQSPFLGFRTMSDRPDSLIPLAAADEFEKKYWYWDVFPPTPGSPVAYLSISINFKTLLHSFLSRVSLPGIYVYDLHLRRWSPAPPHPRLFAAIATQAHVGRRAAHLTFRNDGREYLASAYPSLSIDHFCCLTLTDLAPIRRHVDTMKALLGSGFLFLGLMAWIFSRLLARSILLPVGELVNGMKALEERRFSHRLEPLGPDEFGELAVTFNRMMTGLQDLDMGRELQERLLPGTLPAIPGYEAAFRYQSASELGGDFVDLLPLPGGRYLFLVADVTGHGVSAALVTAMIKAVAFAGAQADSSLPELFTRMDLLIAKVVKKARMMTMLAGILDPATHVLEMLGAGHPYPLITKQGGRVEEVAFTNPMFGARWKKPWEPRTVALQPGEAVLVYSDGLYEAHDVQGRPFDFERVSRVFGISAALSPQHTVEALWRAQTEFLNGAAPQDDVTLLVLRRNP